MRHTCFSKVKIRGISVTVPKKEKSLLNDDSLYNGDQKRISRVINSSGFLCRRIAEDDTMTSDLCYQAAIDLISKLSINKLEIDALLFISYTPDYLMPATSYVLHKRLGLSQDCVVMDIPQACSGFVIGLFQSAMLINSGCKKVLLLVGDCFSKFTDMFKNNTAPVFGDAGSATLLEYDAKCTEKMHFNIYSDGNNYDALICNNGGFKNPPKKSDFYEDNYFMYNSEMSGGKIFEFAMNNISPSVDSLLSSCKINKDDVDYFVFHQANKFIIENLVRQLDIDVNRVPMTTLSKYGNQCGASIPCAIADVLKSDVESRPNKLLCSGFGVGLSWANCIINLDKIYCSGVVDYENES